MKNPDKLRENELLVLDAIAHGTCEPTYSGIKKVTELADNTLSKVLRKLKDAELILAPVGRKRGGRYELTAMGRQWATPI